MTPAQRLRFEQMTDRTRPRTFDLIPSVEDVRICLKEIDRLQFALSAAVQRASDAAFFALPAKRRPS